MCLAVSRERPYELRHERWPNHPNEFHASYMAEENQLFVLYMGPSTCFEFGPWFDLVQETTNGAPFGRHLPLLF